ncbi:MAG: hypothetical protein M1587_03860 [Thaumarchaeota archaeon]|nr:hypothetical protein [Nitrososphaerota archaeon]
MTAIDSALEAVATVILLGTAMSAYKMARHTGDAKIVAISSPRLVTRFMAAAFVSLFLSSLLGLVSDLFFRIPHIVAVQDLLVISTAIFGVIAVRTALYFYRSAPESLRTSPKSENTAQKIPGLQGGNLDVSLKSKREP